MAEGYFKLLLLKNFIDAIEIIDTDMGYLKYRTMVYAFQDLPRRVRTRESVNNSLEMQSTIQYWQHPRNLISGSLDDLRYTSRR